MNMTVQQLVDALEAERELNRRCQATIKEQQAMMQQLEAEREEERRKSACRIDTLQRMIEQQRKEMEELLEKYVLRKKAEMPDVNQQEFDELLEDLRALADQAQAEQLDELDNARDPEDADESDEEPAADKKPKKKRPNHNGRMTLPAHLHREIEEIEVPEDERIDPITGKPYRIIDYKDTEKIDITPARIFVHVTRRPVFEVPGKNKSVLYVPELPPCALPKWMITNGFAAELCVQRFDSHLPYERFRQALERHGFHVTRKTMSNWAVEIGCNVFTPVYNAHVENILSGNYIGFDDTPVPLQVRDDQGAYSGGLRSSRIWVVRSNTGPPQVFYKFTVTKEKEEPIALLGPFQGYAQADAAPGHDQVMNTPGIIELGCWAHATRRFKEAVACHPHDAKHLLGLIDTLYCVEAEAEDQPPDIRLALRQEKSQPIMDELFESIEIIHPRLLPKSPLAEATTYCINQKPHLQRYLTDGMLNIDNNPTEREIRPWGIGRKNWEFFGGERGGVAAAVIMSFTRTCRNLRLNPWLYIKDVLDRLPTHPADRMHELIPINWQCSEANLKLGVPVHLDPPKEDEFPED